jgi:hypothetical protein
MTRSEIVPFTAGGSGVEIKQWLEENIQVTCYSYTSRCDWKILGPSGWRMDPPNQIVAPADIVNNVPNPLPTQVFVKQCTGLVNDAVFLPKPEDDPYEVHLN